MEGLQQLKNQCPWPLEKPNVEENPGGWFAGQNRHMLNDYIREKDPIIIVELGSWLGMSTRFLCEQSSCASIVIAIDHWKGSAEHQNLEAYPFLPVLYETFLVNCWKFKDKLIPFREDTRKGLLRLAKLGIKPDLVYVDASHETEEVLKDLDMIAKLFPETDIVGDDWTWTSVREGVFKFCLKYLDYDLHTQYTCYRLRKRV